MRPERSKRRAIRRRGVLILCVLASLALVAALLAVWMKTLALERQQVRAQQLRVQAEYLADAGLRRGIARLDGNAAYAGETWQIGAETLAAREPASVTITVAESENDPPARLVSATARVAAGRTTAARTKQEQVTLPSEEPTP